MFVKFLEFDTNNFVYFIPFYFIVLIKAALREFLLLKYFCFTIVEMALYNIYVGFNRQLLLALYNIYVGFNNNCLRLYKTII